MAKMVGLSRNIRLAWLNYMVELAQSGISESEMRDKLNEYLSYEITSPINVRKTREILMCIWAYENRYTSRLRPEALRLIAAYPEEALEIHWCMMMAAYPVFTDLCRLIGKMTEFQEEITLSQIKQKLFDQWGERATLYHSIDKLISTLKEFGVLLCDKPGKYRVNHINVRHVEVSHFMVYTVMNIDGSGYYSFQQLQSSVYLYPFAYNIEKERFLSDNRFTVNYFGGQLSVGLKGLS